MDVRNNERRFGFWFLNNGTSQNFQFRSVSFPKHFLQAHGIFKAKLPNQLFTRLAVNK